MFAHLILVNGALFLSFAIGIVIADKIEDYKRKKNLKKTLNQPTMVKVRIVDNGKTTIDYVDSAEELQKLVQKYLTK
jgi:hypothetical protein